jgi:phosphoglycerol transferase MdoB-like AlkP superfamily enzyme
MSNVKAFWITIVATVVPFLIIMGIPVFYLKSQGPDLLGNMFVALVVGIGVSAGTFACMSALLKHYKECKQRDNWSRRGYYE